jgi:hypothetical protein
MREKHPEKTSKLHVLVIQPLGQHNFSHTEGLAGRKRRRRICVRRTALLFRAHSVQSLRLVLLGTTDGVLCESVSGFLVLRGGGLGLV